MISLNEKYLCCGCEACNQICPQSCITMKSDSEGFAYPSVNVKECINCHLCEKVCPVINQDVPHSPLSIHAVMNKDPFVRYHSSSGGVFSLLAEQCIEKGGVVFGAKWNQSWEVEHGFTETKDGIPLFRGSKYVQSKINTAFKDVRYFLLSGRMVLFSGTPCQIRALKLFLGRDFDSLFLVDFVCHGVPSPGVFQKYLQEELDKCVQTDDYKPSPIFSHGGLSIPKGYEIRDIRFRDKKSGWKRYSFVLDLAESLNDGNKRLVSLSTTIDDNAYLQGFLHNLFLRPSCYQCPTKEFKSGADITLADFWEVDSILKDLNDDLGLSKVFINTPKGEKFLKKINADIHSISSTRVSKNKMILSSAHIPPDRKVFFEQQHQPFSQTVSALTSPSRKEYFTQILRKLIPSSLLQIIKRIKYSL